jgi:hypothetical protein
MSADMLFPRRFLLASQAEENSRFLRLIFISLLLQFARNTREAAAGHKQNHQHPRNFHYCSPSRKLFLLRKKWRWNKEQWQKKDSGIAADFEHSESSSGVSTR